MASERPSDQISEWLSTLGLNRNPFFPWESGADPELDELLVEHNLPFQSVYTPTHSFIFEGPGEGKTALSLRLARACRVGEQGASYFPIPVNLGYAFLGDDSPLVTGQPEDGTIVEAFLTLRVLQSAALELFGEVAYRPYHFINAGDEQQGLIKSFWQDSLPIDLDYLLNQLVEGVSIPDVMESHDLHFKMPKHPKAEAIAEFCKQVKTTTPAESHIDNIADLITLLKSLRYSNAFLILDGLDSLPETLNDPEMQMGLVRPLLEKTVPGLHIKAAFPDVMKQLFGERYPRLTPGIIEIRPWTEDGLKDLLNQRMAVATQIGSVSLDMICDPGLRKLAEKIVREVVETVGPNPREVLFLTNKVLEAHIYKSGPIGKITKEDWETVLEKRRRSKSEA